MRRTIALLLALALVSAALITRAEGAPPGQKRLVVGIVQDPPFTFKDRTGNWTGFNVELWQLVAQELKLDFGFREMSFNDLLKALGRGEIDFSAATIYITEKRERDFDYTISFGSAPLGVAIRPDSDFHPWRAAMRIFMSWGTFKVLGSLLLILVAVGGIIWLIESRHNPDHFGGGPVKGLGAGVYWVGSTMASGVCYGVSLKSLPGRIAGLVWMFLCAVALSALTATLASSLTARHLLSDQITRDTLRQMRLGAVTDDASATMVKKLGARCTIYTEEEDVLDALLKGEIDGFVFDEVTLQYYAETGYRNKITVKPTELARLPFAFGLPTDSPLRKPVNAALLKIMEQPVWDALLLRYGLAENFEPKQLTARDRRSRFP